ncbi:hypothetical protein EIK77_000842 [Talaromyces pinophilus]|nr:hypothetical protein EIK77_000842 [Talaromyces pinophilus]PCG88114.1 Hypothetical protein PENO1_112070 [Penicillium occitanis (nom. inval.)]PCG88123.1 hypothetical protein PENOC_112360 [Penicillium occitanis (nom. inval.)]
MSGNGHTKSGDPHFGSSPARTTAETTANADGETELPPEPERQHPLPSFGGLGETEPPPPENETVVYGWLEGVPAMNTDIARFNEHDISTPLPDVWNPIAPPPTPATPFSFPQQQPRAAGQFPAVPTFQPRPRPSPDLTGLGSYGAASLAPASFPLLASYKFEESISYHTINGGQHTISVVESFEAPASCAQGSEANHAQS